MSRKPDYFESIRQKAAGRWVQLEQDPELAGPWHQLFKQVQSPRHVVSELLQNADDAGASEAAVDLQDGEFVFTHNGELTLYPAKYRLVYESTVSSPSPTAMAGDER